MMTLELILRIGIRLKLTILVGRQGFIGFRILIRTGWVQVEGIE